MSEHPNPEKLSDEEFKRRFVAHVMERAHLSEGAAIETFEALTIEDWREYDDEPETAADVEMDEWTDDGDD